VSAGPAAAAAHLSGRWIESHGSGRSNALRLTEPRSGPRVCDSQQLRQARSTWEIY